MTHSIRWRIGLPYVILILLSMAGLGITAYRLAHSAYVADLQAHLTSQAHLIGDALRASLGADTGGESLDPAARYYARLLDSRVTIIGADGTVVGESHEDRTQMDNHLGRPEVQQALATGQGSSIRYSRTAGYDTMYAAVAVRGADGRLTGFVRVALPLRQVEADAARLRHTVLVATLLASLGATLLAVLIADRTTRPARWLTAVVRRLADGDLSARLFLTDRDEIGVLATAVNQMAERFQETVTSLGDERARLATILDHMADGVLIVDERGRVRLINPAASRLLGISREAPADGSLAELARDHRLIRLWQQCRSRQQEQSETVEMDRRGPFLHVIATPLRGAGSGTCLIILQDLTRVRRLESVRRDFISNVSHELRTPLASLKAVADTLRDGALEDPAEAQRFLDRMDIEIDMLSQMVQELLDLSRIESGRTQPRLVEVAAAELILPPVERLRPQADRAGLTLQARVPADLPFVQADPDQIRRAITNLVHNALKFTPPGGRVEVSASALDTRGQHLLPPEAPALQADALAPGLWVVITVEDTGVGIPSDDLPRIFERFYKADRARSGGGTGLGLAIVKHIVHAHGGHIWAHSVEGQGSTFYVVLRAVEPPLTNH